VTLSALQRLQVYKPLTTFSYPTTGKFYVNKTDQTGNEMALYTAHSEHMNKQHISYKQVRQWGLTYIHTCLSYAHTPRDFTNRASLARRLARALNEL